MTISVADALERIEADDARLNCFTAVYRDEALAAARTVSDGALAGRLGRWRHC